MDPVSAMRQFNRFYTNLIGALRAGLLDTPYSLTEARVIFELAHANPAEVVQLRRDLDIDAGYLSRILRRLEADGLAERERSTVDGRRQLIRLTPPGEKVFAELDGRSSAQIRAVLDRVSPADQERLVGAMTTIEEVLAGGRRPNMVVLRPFGPGDLGWVIQRHGVLYSEQYGWSQSFEAHVAEIVAEFAKDHDPQRERAWIAEVDGAPVGCVFCVRNAQDGGTAQLRLLLVEPSARGLGVGTRLVDECLRFAKRAGYRDILLWTNDVLVEARRIYQRAGFQLESQYEHEDYGPRLVAQYWRLILDRADPAPRAAANR